MLEKFSWCNFRANSDLFLLKNFRKNSIERSLFYEDLGILFRDTWKKWWIRSTKNLIGFSFAIDTRSWKRFFRGKNWLYDSVKTIGRLERIRRFDWWIVTLDRYREFVQGFGLCKCQGSEKHQRLFRIDLSRKCIGFSLQMKLHFYFDRDVRMNFFFSRENFINERNI